VAVLAWVAKIRWSQEYAAAKDEIIRSKDAEIKVLEREIDELRELNPMKVREYFLSMKVQLEEYNDRLQEEKKSLQVELREKNALIRQLKESGEKDSERIKRLLDERKELQSRINKAATVIDEVQSAGAGTADIYQKLKEMPDVGTITSIPAPDERKILLAKSQTDAEEEVKGKENENDKESAA
jgi:chromosome segregation ATPase